MPVIRRVTIVRRWLLVSPPVYGAGPGAPPLSLWDRTPKILLCLLAVFFAFIGKIAAVALHGSMALQVILGSAGAVFGFYLVKIMPWLVRAVLVIGGLAALVAFAVWLKRLLVH